MTSSPPSVESADDLAKRMRRWAEDAPIAQRSELRVVMKAWADEVEADRKTRLTIDELIAFRKTLWADLDAVCVAKGADYSGKTGDTFKNIRSCEAFGLPSSIGIMVRVGDKYNRAFELLMREYKIGDGPEVRNEKVEDTIKDAINYLSYILAIRSEAKQEDSGA